MLPGSNTSFDFRWITFIRGFISSGEGRLLILSVEISKSLILYKKFGSFLSL